MDEDNTQIQNDNTTAVDNTPVDTNMPPITRPDDLVSENAGITASDSFANGFQTPGAQTDFVQPAPDTGSFPVVPAEPESYFAPMPKMKETAPAPIPESVAPPLEQLPVEVPQQVNPAMVPDPLMGVMPSAEPVIAPIAAPISVAVDGSAIDYPQTSMAVEPAPLPPVSQSSSKKKIVITSIVAVLTLALLGVGGYFGYIFYVSSSNISILNKAAKKLTDTKEFSTKVTLGVDALAVTAKLDYDKDQDIRMELENDIFPIKAYYMKSKDSLYLESPDYSDYSTTSTKKTSATKKSLIEYKKMTPAIDEISKKYINLKNVDPKKNTFGSANLKYIKRDADESVGGKQYFKFTFTPSKEMIDEAVKELTKESEGASIGLKEANISISIWIEKGTFKVGKTEGSAEATIDLSSIYGTAYSSSDMEKGYKLTWKQEFDYGFSDNIKLPIGSKVVESVDVSAMITGGSGSPQSKAEDAKMKANVHEIQNALEQYYVDNEVYPTQAQGLTVLVTSYLSSAATYDGITYKVNSAGGYELSFILKNQETDIGDYVKGSPRVYFVTSKQQ